MMERSLMRCDRSAIMKTDPSANASISHASDQLAVTVRLVENHAVTNTTTRMATTPGLHGNGPSGQRRLKGDYLGCVHKPPSRKRTQKQTQHTIEWNRSSQRSLPRIPDCRNHVRQTTCHESGNTLVFMNPVNNITTMERNGPRLKWIRKTIVSRSQPAGQCQPAGESSEPRSKCAKIAEASKLEAAMEQFPFLIGGHEQTSGPPQPVLDKYDGSVVGEVFNTDESALREAVSMAVQARTTMADLPAHERSRIILDARAKLEEKKTRLAEIIAREAGKPLKYALGEVDRCLENLVFAAGEALRIHGETVPMDASSAGRIAPAILNGTRSVLWLPFRRLISH